jgi:hypothetical protein
MTVYNIKYSFISEQLPTLYPGDILIFGSYVWIVLKNPWCVMTKTGFIIPSFYSIIKNRYKFIKQ